MTRSKDIGTAGETAVVHYLRSEDGGFPQAERRALHGQHDLGDITGCPGIVIEVKAGAAAMNASDGQVEAWLIETDVERQNAEADYGVLVLKRAGYGPARAGQWWAVLPMWQLASLLKVHPSYLGAHGDRPVRLHLDTVCTLLRLAGYGQPLTFKKDAA